MGPQTGRGLSGHATDLQIVSGRLGSKREPLRAARLAHRRTHRGRTRDSRVKAVAGSVVLPCAVITRLSI